MEVWRTINDHSNYEISSFGRVRNKKTGRVLKQFNRGNNYLCVNLGRGNLKYVHKLVANIFLELDKERTIVNHKDGDKTNNHVSNLEWTTYGENNIHAIKLGLRVFASSKIGAKEIEIIETGERYPTIHSCARAIKGDSRHIWDCLKGHRRSHRGLTFKYTGGQSMAIELYEHQKDAVEKLRNGNILVGGVGSGKSRTALAYFFIKVCDGKIKTNNEGGYSAPKKPKNLLIITTARKRDCKEWQQECSPFLLSTNKEDSVCGIEVIIDSWNNISKYSDLKNWFVILDEQRIIGSGTWVKSFLKIAKNNEWILLSATPGDQWQEYIPVFVANNFYKNRTEFVRRHVVFSNFSKFPKVDHYVEVGRLIKLRDAVIVNMRYNKRTIAHDENVIVPFDKELFNTVMIKRWNIYEQCPIKDISELCYIMRKVVNSDPRRVHIVGQLLEKHPKIIVFYNFNYERDLLLQLGEELKITTTQWNGHKHEPIPDTDKWMYIVQYAAGAEGWNCIETDTIIFYSQNYSYKARIQAAGRIDRLNTPFTDLNYYYLRSMSYIDLAIKKAFDNKKDFNENRFMSA